MEASINSPKIIKNYLWKKFIFNKIYQKIKTFSKIRLGQITFQEGTNHVKGFTEIHSGMSTLSNGLFCDKFVKLTVIFVILLYKTIVLLSVKNSLDNNMLNANNKNFYKVMHHLI